MCLYCRLVAKRNLEKVGQASRLLMLASNTNLKLQVGSGVCLDRSSRVCLDRSFTKHKSISSHANNSKVHDIGSYAMDHFLPHNCLLPRASDQEAVSCC